MPLFPPTPSWFPQRNTSKGSMEKVQILLFSLLTYRVAQRSFRKSRGTFFLNVLAATVQWECSNLKHSCHLNSLLKNIQGLDLSHENILDLHSKSTLSPLLYWNPFRWLWSTGNSCCPGEAILLKNLTISSLNYIPLVRDCGDVLFLI